MDPMATYRTARRIADLWFEAVAEERAAGSDLSASDHRATNTVNPFYNRASAGIGVEFYYGSPHQVFTPWGQWHFSGGGHYTGDAQNRSVARYMAKVGLKVHTPMRMSSAGEHGPVYAVETLDGASLSALTVVPYDGDNYTANRDEWARLTAEYVK